MTPSKAERLLDRLDQKKVRLIGSIKLAREDRIEAAAQLMAESAAFQKLLDRLG